MNNCVLDTIELTTDCLITLESRQSKNGSFYNCVVLTSNGVDIIISFDLSTFNNIKRKLKK